VFPIIHRVSVLPAYCVVEGVFNDGQLDALEAEAAEAEESGGVEGQQSAARRCKVKWLEAPPLYEALGTVIADVNSQTWRLDLSGFAEKIQLTRYEAEVAGHYDWHQDVGRGISRKLSLTVQLTDPGAYDGGNLEMLVSGSPIPMSRARGAVVVFPSWQLHRVSPVTRGARNSLVVWVNGPQLR
jgi:PKHD-type hydroxylase